MGPKTASSSQILVNGISTAIATTDGLDDTVAPVGWIGRGGPMREVAKPALGRGCRVFGMALVVGGAWPRSRYRAGMSDLDRARDMYDAWNEGNVDRIIDFWWDDSTWEDLPEIPDRRIIHGRENVESHLREVMAVIGDLKMEVIELEELGEEVLGSVRFRVVGSASGISVDTPSFHLICFEGGLIRRYRTFSTREDALEAAEHGSRPGH